MIAKHFKHTSTLAFLSLFILSSSTPSGSSTPTVEIKNGTVIGVHSGSYDQDWFLGIPYAQPPVDELRLQLPQSLNSSFGGPKYATQFGPICVGFGPDDVGPDITLSEDCLTLNIVRPAGCVEANLPVGVWIYGGGFIFGGSAAPQYNLSFIVENSVKIGKPIIGVSINYRVSAWGWMFSNETLVAGVTNLGARDARLALQWLQENVVAFGGDPTKVTVWGESAGAGIATLQTTAFGGRDDGLFRGVISESGPVLQLGYLPLPAGQAIYDNITRDAGCASATNTLECLRKVSFDTFNRAVNITPPYSFAPAVDGDFVQVEGSIQLRNGQFTRTPLLIGTNTDEGTLFGPTGINTDAEFRAYVASLGTLTNESIARIEQLYPNIPALGLPATLHGRPGDPPGIQYKRTTAFATDWSMLAGRRFSTQAWAKYGVPSYAYRFNVFSNGYTDVQGVTHYAEVAFVFDNTMGLGDVPNPFAGEPPSYKAVASLMSKSWAAFIHDLNPNGHGVPEIPHWPAYSNERPQDFVFSAKTTSHPEPDTYRAEGTTFINSIDTDQFHR